MTHSPTDETVTDSTVTDSSVADSSVADTVIIDAGAFAAIIPAYNATRTLHDTVASARAAGAASVLVVNDGSTDATADLAASLGCTVITQANAGAAAARRTGIAAATEPFVVLLDSDDCLEAAGVAESIRQLLAAPEAVAAQGRTTGIGHGGARRDLRHWPGGVTAASLIARGHAPGPPAAFVWRTDSLREVIGGEPAAVWPRFAEDYELIVRGALLGEIRVHDEVSCVYRWVGGKSGASPRNSILDADSIRLHYARLTGSPATPRSAAEVRSMVWLRRASEHTSTTSLPTRLAYTGLAVLANPVDLGSRGLTRLARRGRTVRGATLTEAEQGTHKSPARRIVTGQSFGNALRADLRANPRDPKARLVMLSFRVAQLVMGNLDHPRLISVPFVVVHRFMTEFLLGVELRPKTSVGAGLTIYHGTGLVVNDHARIGRGVVLRNGVTIGHQVDGGGSPVIGDNVAIGASALILGDIEIGEGAVIGAGAVVVKPVGAYTSVAGNPARKIKDLPRP